MTAKREPWIDNVKALAILMVIIGHSIGLLNSVPGSMRILSTWIVAVNMPLFVIMTGWTAYRGFDRIENFASLLAFSEKLFERTVLPSVAVSSWYAIYHNEFLARRLWIIFFGVTGIYFVFKIYNNKLPQYLNYVLRTVMIFFLVGSSFSINYFWFLVMIIEFQSIGGIISLLLHHLKLNEAKRFWWGCLFFCIVVYGLCPGWSKEFPLYFCIGLLAYRLRMFDNLVRMPIWGFLVAFIVSLGSALYCRHYSFYEYAFSALIEHGAQWFFFLRQINGIVISMIIIRIVIACSGNYNEISRFGSFSMSLYMVHTQITAISPISFTRTTVLLCWFQLLLIVVVLTGISYALILLFNVWGPSRKLFLGKD